MKKLAAALRLAAGTAIISFLFYKIGIKSVLQTLATTSLTHLAAYLALVLITLAIGAYKIKLLTDPIKKLSFAKILRYYMLSFSTGLFVPARAGEFILVYFLKKEGIEIPKGAAIALLDKIIIMAFLSIIAVFGFFVFFTPTRAAELMAMLIATFLALSVLMLSKKARSIIKKYVLRKYADKFSGLTEAIGYYIKKQKAALMINLSATAIKWLITAVAVAILFSGFSQHPSTMHVLMILAIGTITTLIPITLSGLGIREGVAVYLFSQTGIATEITLTVYMIMLITNYILAALSMTFLKWQK